jgi:hypothetical protein
MYLRVPDVRQSDHPAEVNVAKLEKPFQGADPLPWVRLPPARDAGLEGRWWGAVASPFGRHRDTAVTQFVENRSETVRVTKTLKQPARWENAQSPRSEKCVCQFQPNWPSDPGYEQRSGEVGTLPSVP